MKNIYSTDDFENIRRKQKELLTVLSVFASCSSTRIYQKGEMIYFQDDLTTCLYYVKSGRVKTYTIIKNDVDKRLFSYDEGMIFGLDSYFDVTLHSSSASACCRTELVIITQEMLEHFLKEVPDLSITLLTIMSQELRIMTKQAISASGEQANVRIARYILRTIRNIRIKTGQQTDIINVTQDAIASQFGYSRATINRALRFLEVNHWIKLEYRSIKVIDSDALIKFAFDNPGDSQ